MRDKVVRQRIEDYDADGGVGDMLNEYQEAHFAEGCREEPEATTKAYYDIVYDTETPSRPDKCFSTGWHWTCNGLEVPV
jgi:hypothetical protein